MYFNVDVQANTSHSAYVPEDKCHPDKITPWEVAAIRQIEGQNNIQYVLFNRTKF